MKVIVAGSRSIVDISEVQKAITESRFEITEVVSGTAKGVDKLGESYAVAHNIPVKKFPADWDRFRKKAGYLRNQEMAEYAEALIAIWDGESKGTAHMINIMKKIDKPVYVWKVINV